VASANTAIDDLLATTIGGANVSHRYAHAVVGFAAGMTPQQAAALRADPRILHVEPDMIARGTGEASFSGNPDIPDPWGLRRISSPDGLAPEFDPCGADGSGVTIAIVDSGIAFDHTEFEDRIVAAVNFYPGSDSPEDEFGHGTHVASIAAGATVGVARAADIAALRVLGPDNTGPNSGIIAALNWLANPFNIEPPATVNMSLGGWSPAILSNIYYNALAAVSGRGIPIVVSAGNDAYPALWSLPSNSADTLTIGATGILDRPAVFSNNGPTVDLWAPGVNILAADSRRSDGGLKLDSGTSMASPMAAGVMALQLQRNPPSIFVEIPEAASAESMRQRLALIAATVEGRLEDWTSPIDVAVGGNGALAGASNRLLQACPPSSALDCEEPLVWQETTASIILGDGIDLLAPGFSCSRTVSHPSGIVQLNVDIPAVVPRINADGSITDMAANILITDIATETPIWASTESWITQAPIDRSASNTVVATGMQGLRIDWIPIDAETPGGYGYAMTANVIAIQPGNLDRDGDVGGADLLMLLGEWGPCLRPACAADLNHDGIVDGADLTLLLSYWGEVITLPYPGFIHDCDGNQVPASWLGDQFLDDGTRQYAPTPFQFPIETVTANLNCPELSWDAPNVGFSVSPEDPRPGACVLPDGTCIETAPLACGQAAGFFLGHGRTCDQLGETIRINPDYECPEGTIGYGSPSQISTDVINDSTYFGKLWRQPIDPGLGSIDSITMIGTVVAMARSNSNRFPEAHGYGRPSLSTDLEVTLGFRDASDPVSFVRTPERSPLTRSGMTLVTLGYTIDVAFAGDGREIASIQFSPAAEGLGPAESCLLGQIGTFLEADDPSPGAEFSVDGGLTWQPIIGTDGRRYQLTLCITP
jgi:hypothetical protein